MKLYIVTAQLNLNSSWSDYIMAWTTPPHPWNSLSHFQATQEAGFRYATLFWPNKKDDLQKKNEDDLKKMKMKMT